MMITSSLFRFLSAGSVLLAGLWFDGRPQPAQAQAEPVSSLPTCSNLDVVFLIDQSTSMSGYLGSVPSDPTEQRKYAPEAMVDLLSDIALDTCPESHHRMAVVSWGSNVQIDLPLSDIAPDTFTDAQDLRERLKRSITARQMGQTDPKLAFAQATAILNDAAPVGTGIRKRVIIFITDGQPCVATLGCSTAGSTMDFTAYARQMRDQIAADLPFDATLRALEACLAPLRDVDGSIPDAQATAANTCLDQHRVPDSAYHQSTYIYQILLGFGEAYSERLREIYEDIATSHAGRVISLSSNRTDIPSTFNQILTQLAGVKATRLTCGNFAVNPYLARMRLVMFKFDAAIQVRFSYVDADGIRHVISNGQAGPDGGFDVVEYYQYGANERYEFATPYPGIWQLESESCDGLDAYYDPIQIDPGGSRLGLPSIPQYDRDPFFDPAQPTYLEYQMRDRSGAIVRQADWPQFAVTVTATVSGPQDTQNLALIWDPTSERFRATEPLRVPTPGTYTVDLVGTTVEHVGPPAPVDEDLNQVFVSPRVLFRQTGEEFTVTPVTPFVVSIESPAAGAQLSPIHGSVLEGWPLPVTPIPVRVRLLDRGGQPLANPDRVLSDPEQALSAQVRGPNGSSAKVSLRPLDGTPGTYVGEIAGFADEGSLTLVVTLDSGVTQDYRPDSTEVKVAFLRSDGLLGRATTYYGLLGLAAALGLAAVFYNLKIRDNPVRGMLIFRDDSYEIASFGLATGRNWRDIGARELRAYPQLRLKRLRIENRGKSALRRRGRSNPDVVLGDSLGIEDAGGGVRLRGVSSEGRHFSLDLDPQLPVSYSDDSIAQVIYEPL